jgi:hypothetical protein
MRCLNFLNNGDQTEQLPMPGMLITPFAPIRNVRNAPPSNFEYVASKFARTNCNNQDKATQFNNHWSRINNVYSSNVRAAEQTLWNGFGDKNPHQLPLYGNLLILTTDGLYNGKY